MCGLLLVLTLAGPGFVAGSETSLSQWREIGEKYVLADQKLLQLDQSKLEGIPQQLELRDKLRADLDQVPPPTNDELASLLDSPDPLDRKTALVAALAKHITSPSITKIIVNRYNDESDFFIRFYSHQALMNLSDDQVRSVQADILRMIRNEKYESHLITSLPTLLRLERDAVIPVLVKYFKEGTSGLKKATYATLRAKHDDYLREVKNILKRDGAKRALKYIDKLDKL